ncbi:acyl-CoA N-acyltransferase [Microdochium trichocladiopsis]|uniref:Acyl-CoA N-acyltransferase n=1 Tax=Microdochium trichocladiopsis TaxID=1682393 RepID=A0A9P8YD88_9PEZI|nr:acyl-CoA N-acyltransferase [Microdochium trichocladiopsis]KAH7039677.1 acyl-CoA N-acyltransferase [Microdochium trichocladiopsis]
MFGSMTFCQEYDCLWVEQVFYLSSSITESLNTDTIRLAGHSDLDAIVAVAIAALPADPVNPYRYPRWQEFPEDYAKFTRIRYAGWLAEPNNVVMVCEVPGSDLGNTPDAQERETAGLGTVEKGDRRIVGFSIWELPPSQRVAAQDERADRDPSSVTTENALGRLSPALNSSIQAKGVQAPSKERPDANPARVAKYTEEFLKAKHRFFEEPFGDKNLYLSILACHPAYHRRGIGKQLVRWGLEKARREGLDLTVFGSPMGSLLYRNVGFREVGKFRVQVDGEEEYLDTLAMVLENKDIA